MNRAVVPRKAVGHHVETMGSEQVLFGEARAAAYFLNESAALVFSLCDGKRSLGEIVDLLAEAYPDSGVQLETDVIGIIGSLTGEGVLELS